MSLKKIFAKAILPIFLTTSFYFSTFTKKSKAVELVLPNGVVLVLPDDNKTQQSNTNLYKQSKASKQKQEKHYSWIRPDKYSKWQCAYELIYPNNDKTRDPKGFYLYVDEDGDGKVDYKYKYWLEDINAFYGGAIYEFSLATGEIPIGSGWKENAYKAMNVCGPDAIKNLFYKRDDLAEEPSEYEIVKVNYDIYYPEVTFKRR